VFITYCRTYHKTVCGGERGTVKEMYYEERRADRSVNPNPNLDPNPKQVPQMSLKEV
jgi:hypothetical protein